ncbi:MAG: type II toxin-antitoxin system RatA family toxin [Acidobacteriota bacterium]
MKTTKTATAEIPGDPGLVYDILTDYDTYSDWMPHISRSKLLAREGDLAIAEFEVDAPKKGQFAVECIHTRNRQVMTRTISGDVPLTEVAWDLTPGSPGTTSVKITMRAAGWKTLLPAYRKYSDATKCLKALHKQAATFGDSLAVEDSSGEKVFELAETEQGLVCWHRGKKYTLTPAAEGK